MLTTRYMPLEMFLPREALSTVRAEDHDIDLGSSFIACSSNII